MANHDICFTRKSPLFDGTNYAFRRVRMKTYLMSLGFEIWKFAVDGHKAPTSPPSNQNGKKIYVNNAKSMDAVFYGLSK